MIKELINIIRSHVNLNIVSGYNTGILWIILDAIFNIFSIPALKKINFFLFTYLIYDNIFYLWSFLIGLNEIYSRFGFSGSFNKFN